MSVQLKIDILTNLQYNIIEVVTEQFPAWLSKMRIDRLYIKYFYRLITNYFPFVNGGVMAKQVALIVISYRAGNSHIKKAMPEVR